LRDRHLPWADQRILDAKGPPDWVRIEDYGSEDWTFLFDEGALGFSVHDGRVVSAHHRD
jgi:hypothetical protein